MTINIYTVYKLLLKTFRFITNHVTRAVFDIKDVGCRRPRQFNENLFSVSVIIHLFGMIMNS